MRRRNNVLDTEREFLVKIVFFLARVGKGDIIECDDRRWKFANVFKVEPKRRIMSKGSRGKMNNVPQGSGGLDFFDETGSFHLVDDLLFGLGLTNEVGVCTRRRNEPD